MSDELLLRQGSATLELFLEILRQRGTGHDDVADALERTIHPDDVDRLAVELRRLSSRVATTDGANEAATHAAPPLGSVTSAGGASLRPCDPVDLHDFSLRV